MPDGRESARVDRWSKAPEGASVTPGYKVRVELDRRAVDRDWMARTSTYVGLFALVVSIGFYLYTFSPFRGFGAEVIASVAVVQVCISIIGIVLAARSWHCACWNCSRMGLWLSISSLVGPCLLLGGLIMASAYQA